MKSLIYQFKKIQRAAIAAALLALTAGCAAGGDEQQILASPGVLTPADAGICTESKGELAEVVLNPDAPTPRCLIVRGTQRLNVVNRFPDQITLLLGGKGLEVSGSGEGSFPLRFEQYLQKGGHVARISLYDPDTYGFEVRLE